MTYFLKSGAQFRVTTKEAMDLHERLPVGTYTVGFDTCSGQHYLEQIDKFEVSGKLYGNTTRNADRILRTFNDRSSSTGVLLAGEKGSGKTMLAKLISTQAAEEGVPTIVINKNWHGEDFNGFLQKIDQPTVVIFDEFEKVYNDSNEQEQMLTLLDGVYPSKKLFLLTCNDKWRVDSNMRNRPGRIFYMLDFHGLEGGFIQEYCEDNLIQKEHIKSIVAISGLFSAFNFDMLKGMVEDMNRYGESPSQVLQFLNVRPEFSSHSKYAVDLHIAGVKAEDIKSFDEEWHGNPIKQDIRIDYTFCKRGDDGEEEEEDSKEIRFKTKQMEKLDARADTYVFANEEGSRLTLTPCKTKFSVNYDTLGSLSNLQESLVTSSPGDKDKATEDSVLCTIEDMGDY